MNETVQNTIKLIAIYARVSTARQEDEHTIETQLSAVREFAEKKGYVIVKEYIDEGWSGDMLARPQLDQLRQDAKSEIWEGVLTYDPDRLARRYSYQELVMDELKEAEIEVLFVTTPSPKNGEEKILHGVKGLFAEYERVKIAERFRLGKLRVVREGHVLGSDAPYGYEYVPKRDGNHGYYKIRDDEARVVIMIFTWVADEALTVRGVVRRLQEMKIAPRKSKRGVWSTSTLAHLMRNGAYIGEAHYGKSYAVVPENPYTHEKYRKIKKTSRRNRPESEWLKIPVPAIIDRDLYDQVQARLKSNFELSNRNTKNEYLLAGKIRCLCGHRRTGEGPQHGKHLYYRCTEKVKTFPLPRICLEKGINARIADKLVWQKIAALMSSPDLMAKQIERWMKQRHDNIDDSFVDIEVMKREISKLEDEEVRYTKAYGAGLITMENLAEYVGPLRDKVSSLSGQIAKAKSKREGIEAATLPREDEIEVFATVATKVLHALNFEEKRAIIRNVVDNIVSSQQELKVYGYIPIENHVGFKTIHRHCGAP